MLRKRALHPNMIIAHLLIFYLSRQLNVGRQNVTQRYETTKHTLVQSLHNKQLSIMMNVARFTFT